MPELPEVENFRRLLLPLANKRETLSIECLSPKPPRSFITPEQIESLNGNYHVKDVLRKGKLICMVLQCIEAFKSQKCFYLYLHMGMTGRISTPLYIPELESLKKASDDFPPPHSLLKFSTKSVQVCFSDPRKFGSVQLSSTLSDFDDLAPDATTDFGVEGLVNQATGIKVLLLNQKRVVSGVGNWIADEVLYQTELHPDQTYLTLEQATTLKEKLHFILETAITSLERRDAFPQEWLFHTRWNKRAANSGKKVKDPNGRTVVFVTAGGRTSAIVPSIQKKRSQKPRKKDADADMDEAPPGKRKSESSQSNTHRKRASLKSVRE